MVSLVSYLSGGHLSARGFEVRCIGLEIAWTRYATNYVDMLQMVWVRTAARSSW